jgi:hypothetical protein
VLLLTKTELLPGANSSLQSPERCFEVLFPENRVYARVSARVRVRLLLSLARSDARLYPPLRMTKP